MARYGIPQIDGTTTESSRKPTSGVYVILPKPENGKDHVCTGRMTDGTLTHREPSKPEYYSSIADHHAAWCNATREHFGAPVITAAASGRRADPVAARAAAWKRIAEGVVED